MPDEEGQGQEAKRRLHEEERVRHGHPLTRSGTGALRAGTVLTVTVTKPGAFGMVKTLTVKKNKRPTPDHQLPDAGFESQGSLLGLSVS